MFSRKLLENLYKKVVPETKVVLGRWQLKHDHVKCNDYLNNYYGDPGYPNHFKNQWIQRSINQPEDIKK